MKETLNYFSSKMLFYSCRNLYFTMFELPCTVSICMFIRKAYDSRHYF